MTYNWKALAPTHPLSVAEVGAGDLYVPRAGEGALEIDNLLSVGLEQPIAIFGPAGAGKSTELAALASRLETRWFSVLVRLDKVLPYSDATRVEDVLDAIATAAVLRASKELGLRLSRELAGPASSTSFTVAFGFDRLVAAIREIKATGQFGKAGLLVDGLEKASAGLARRTLAELERLQGEANVVVVVPTGLATGPSATALQDYHLTSVGPVDVSLTLEAFIGDSRVGNRFLFDVASRRLGVPTSNIGGGGDMTAVAIRKAVVLSGGLVRTFLQLLQKAALYAAMRGWQVLDEQDVTHAANDQTSFLLRLLKEGDVQALRAAHGTDGLETDVERRVRFLASGLLLETRTAGKSTVRIAPLRARGISPAVTDA